jgi:hypothetical protein
MNYKLDSVKLEFERIYKEYCNTELDNQESDKWIPMLKEFINFRLELSGGENSGCSESIRTADKFLNEIFLFEDLMCDWAGCYRGDYAYENFETLMELVDSSYVPIEVKHQVRMGYIEKYELELE